MNKPHACWPGKYDKNGQPRCLICGRFMHKPAAFNLRHNGYCLIKDNIRIPPWYKDAGLIRMLVILALIYSTAILLGFFVFG